MNNYIVQYLGILAIVTLEMAIKAGSRPYRKASAVPGADFKQGSTMKITNIKRPRARNLEQG